MSDEKQIRETLARNERLYEEVSSIREELRQSIRAEVRGLAAPTRYIIGNLVTTTDQKEDNHQIFGDYRGDAWKSSK